jgi:hypothetical protein
MTSISSRKATGRCFGPDILRQCRAGVPGKGRGGLYALRFPSLKTSRPSGNDPSRGPGSKSAEIYSKEQVLELAGVIN